MSARGLGGGWEVAGSRHGQPGGQVRRSSCFNLRQLFPSKGFFFCHCPQLFLVFYKNETHFLKISKHDKIVLDCQFRLKAKDLKDGD